MRSFARQAESHGRHPLHQDILARRRDPPHAGGDRGARARRPDARFAWLVEEAFAPLVRLHPAVDEVDPGGLAALAEVALCAGDDRRDRGSLARIRARRYDEIVDSQGLLRSALIARIAHGRRHGYDAPASASRWRRCSTMCATRSAASCMRSTRNRMLTGLALGYTPQGAPDFGLDRARFRAAAQRYAVLLHATARPREGMAGGQLDRARHAACARGIDLVLPWGSEAERAGSERIAASLPRARVPERAPLDRSRG